MSGGLQLTTDELAKLDALELPKGWQTDRRVAECRSCRARVVWAVFVESSKRAPFNLDGTPHFASCPDAEKWRRGRRK